MGKGTEQHPGIGLFGGTFDPVHTGHVRAAEEIREAFGLKRVIFIPARVPPHKDGRITPADRRFEMVRLALEGNEAFEVSDIELKRRGSSYAFETIEYFGRLFNDAARLFFIMGQDAFSEIHTWKEYPRFFSECSFLVMSRPGICEGDSGRMLPKDIAGEFVPAADGNQHVHRSGHRVCFCRVTLMDISSTEIRSRCRRGKSIKYIVPDAVERYIREQGLYL